MVNVNPLYKPRELEFQLNDSGAEAIIVLENFAAVLSRGAAAARSVKHVVVASMGDMLGPLKGARGQPRRAPRQEDGAGLRAAGRDDVQRSACRRPRADAFTRPEIGPDDIAFLQYTGGTTGVAKGAMLLHRNLVANVLQVVAWHEPLIAAPPPVDRLIIVTALPLYHIFALTACFLFGMHTGGLCVLIPNPRDINGADQGDGQISRDNVSGGQHALQRAAAITAISASSTGAC